MMLQRQFAISGFHLGIRSLGRHAQHFIGILQRVALQMQHGVNLTNRDPHPLRTFFQGIHLYIQHTPIGLRYHSEETEQLQALRMLHAMLNLSATLADRRSEILNTTAFLLIKEPKENVVALFYSNLTEILTKES